MKNQDEITENRLIDVETGEKFPEVWRGIFYVREEAKKMISMSAQDAVDILRKKDDTIFRVAGLIFDLQFNNMPKKANSIFIEAGPSADFPFVIDLAEFIRTCFVDESQWNNISFIMYKTISVIYKREKFTKNK